MNQIALKSEYEIHIFFLFLGYKTIMKDFFKIVFRKF